MIEKYFEKGAVITGFNFKDVRGTPLSEVNTGIVELTVTITETKKTSILWGLKTKTTTTANEVGFRFLPYAQGAINYCESQGRDVISAYFSGCIMARYTRSGSWRVCHVSTGGSNDCKDKWEEIQGESTVNNVTQFKPHEHVTAGDKILGLITSTGEHYAIGCSATTIEQPETRSAEQILNEHKFTAGATDEEKRKLAKMMAKAKKQIQALQVKSCVKI